MIICSICGGEFEEEEMVDGMCTNCASAIIIDEDIGFGMAV